MPLPYQNYRDGASAGPVESKQMSTVDKPLDYLEVCAEDILSAIKSNNKRALADALRAAFELMDSEPHVEGEHTNA